MEKQVFLIRLIAPRPTFSQDMSEVERAVMQSHIDYWMDLTRKGTSILFGPVLDPRGPWGLGIIEVEDDVAARVIMEQDPTSTSGIGFTYEIHPMRIGAIRTSGGL